jgi:hypothetical protein
LSVHGIVWDLRFGSLIGLQFEGFVEVVAMADDDARNGNPTRKGVMDVKGSDRKQGADQTEEEIVKKIANMTEWTPYTLWEYSTTKPATPEEDSLMKAQRFMAAQSFFLSWQRGKVPTGWLRPRTLADLEGQYSSDSIEAALTYVQRGVEERNRSTTDRIKEKQALPQGQPALATSKPISKAEIDDLKDAYQKFSSDLFDIKTALSNASGAIAELSLRTQALMEKNCDA